MGAARCRVPALRQGAGSTTLAEVTKPRFIQIFRRRGEARVVARKISGHSSGSVTNCPQFPGGRNHLELRSDHRVFIRGGENNRPRPYGSSSARIIKMDAIILSLLLMLLTWWSVFRVAQWLGGWNDRG